MDYNKIIMFQDQLKERQSANTNNVSVLLEPTTGFVYPIKEDDFRWHYNKENSLLRSKEREYFYLTDEICSWILKRNECAFLTCKETQETVLVPGQFIIGRINVWDEGTLADLRVSRVHGTIQLTENGYQMTASPVPTKNGTSINGVALEPGQTIPIKDKDVIGVSRFHLLFNQIPLTVKTIEELSFDDE